jgi:inner membrane protein
LTHTLVGVGMANAFFRRRVGPPAVVILAAASSLPDIDGLAMFLADDSTWVMMRRTFGHSIFLIPLWALGLTALFRGFYPKIPWSGIYGMVMLGAFVHLFFDLVNTFGVVPLWPSNSWRPELSIIFIIDLILTGLLLFPLLIAIPKRMRPSLVPLSRISLILVAFYVAFCAASRFMAQEVLAASQILPPAVQHSFVYAFPEPLGPHRWRGVVRDGDTYRIYLVHTLTGEMELKGEVKTDWNDPEVDRVRRSDLGRRIEWFFKAPVWTNGVEIAGEGDPLETIEKVEVFDLRFRPVLISRGDLFTFKFRVYADGKVLLEE